jgi:hypothetical protein
MNTSNTSTSVISLQEILKSTDKDILRSQIDVRQVKLENIQDSNQKHHLTAEIGLITRRLQMLIRGSLNSNYFIVPGLHGMMP